MSNPVRRFLAYVLIGALAVGSAGPCLAQGESFPRTVTDLSGRIVEIPARPERVAVTGDYPPLAAVVPGDQLVSLDPGAIAEADDLAGIDLLVALDLHAAAYPALRQAATAAGVPVFQVTAVGGLDGWRAAVERLGQATGQEIRAAAALARLDRWLAALDAAIEGEPVMRTLAITPEGYTFGAQTLLTDLIVAAGGLNVAAEAGFDDYRQLDDETVRALRPDVILLTPGWTAEGAAAFAANAGYADVPAVRAGRVLRLPFAPGAPRDPAAAALWLAMALHPEAVRQWAARLMNGFGE